MSLLLRVRPLRGGFYTVEGAIEPLARLMDALYVRESEENYWAPRYGEARDVAELDLSGRIAIVGKGPDLDLLTASDLADFDAVICVNESIHVVEGLGLEVPVLAIQTDSILGDRCKPSTGRLLVALCAAHKYQRVRDKVVFRLDDYPVERVCTGGYAVAIARARGASSLALFAFNAAVDGDLSYARVLHSEPRGTAIWRQHRKVMEEAAADLLVEWRSLAHSSRERTEAALSPASPG